MSAVIEQLARMRRRWGMSRADLAELLGVTTKTIVLCENGVKTPSAKLLFKWADMLGCDLTVTFRR